MKPGDKWLATDGTPLVALLPDDVPQGALCSPTFFGGEAGSYWGSPSTSPEAWKLGAQWTLGAHELWAVVDSTATKHDTRLNAIDGYESLASVLDEALAQAQAGKGKERHANGEPYDAQKIVTLNLQIGSEHGAIFQGCKKAQESARLEAERGDAELLGAINYLAAAVIIRRKLRARGGGK